MTSPFVSIITPSYNCQATIWDTYQSITNQTHKNWEWLVTDDCSTDETWHILQDIQVRDSRVKIARNIKNSGAAVSRNNSLSRAQGDFIAFIDSDDLWLGNKLETQLYYMIDSKCNFSFTAYRLINHKGKTLGKFVDTRQESPISYEDLLRKKATVGCSTVMLRKNAFLDISMPLIRTGQDYALWLKLLKNNELAYPLTAVLTEYRILPNSISRNKFKKAQRQWSIYRDIEGLSYVISLWCFCFYAWRAVFRR